MAQVACLEATYELQKQIAGAYTFLQMSLGSGGQQLFLIPKGYSSEGPFENRQRPALLSSCLKAEPPRGALSPHISPGVSGPEKTGSCPCYWEVSTRTGDCREASTPAFCPKDYLSLSLWPLPILFTFCLLFLSPVYVYKWNFYLIC